MARGRKKREITVEMIADLSKMNKEDYIEKHSVGEMMFLNLYYKYVSSVKQEEPEILDIFDGVLADTHILYEQGAAAWFKHIQESQSKADLICSDILHKIQMNEHSNAEKIVLFDMLKEIRIERCKFMDSASFYDANRHKIIDFIELIKLKNSRIKFLQERRYKVRVLTKEFGEELR